MSCQKLLRTARWISCTLSLFWVCALSQPLLAADWKFQLELNPQVAAQPFTGRVYVFFAPAGGDEPRTGPDWFHPAPFIALDVADWQAGEPLLLSPATRKLLSFPVPLGDLELNGMQAQAVVRLNPHEREIGVGPGNVHSVSATMAGPDQTVVLKVEHTIATAEFPENEFCKLLSVPSPLLTAFHGRPVSLNGAVRLPASYATAPERRYPVILTIPGFGGTHFDGATKQPITENNEQGVEFIRVMLDPSCGLGHHVFADSANNGPVGRALCEEFIAALDRDYRTVPAATARFLTGHSYGGWSSLWLQVTYPQVFGGTWSTSPDPVDFRDFQQVNLYQPGANLFRNEQGQPRPLARMGDRVVLKYADFSDMEHVLGPGGQLHSFEAVFSPRGDDGKPRLLFDRRTGAVDAEVAATWKHYDINLILQENWVQLEPQLTGKLHVYMGDKDTFYLEGATRNLKQTLQALKSDAEIEFLPGKDHFNLFQDGLNQRIRTAMVATFLKQHQP